MVARYVKGIAPEDNYTKPLRSTDWSQWIEKQSVDSRYPVVRQRLEEREQLLLQKFRGFCLQRNKRVSEEEWRGVWVLGYLTHLAESNERVA